MDSGAERSAADPLQPLPWRLGPEPAAPVASETGAPPLLLLLDRRQPIAESIRQHLAATLSEGERQRLAAYRLAADRERFLLGRGGLRRLLGHWLGLAPEAVPLETGAHGKPHCRGGPAFNLSHSGELILLAVHPCRPVGVDVERLRPALNWRAMARRMFSDSERQALEALSEAERPEAFLASWCRLEARLKARGTGLAGLQSLRAERAPAALSARSHGAEQLWDVAMPDGYRAAVALAGQAVS